MLQESIDVSLWPSLIHMSPNCNRHWVDSISHVGIKILYSHWQVCHIEDVSNTHKDLLSWYWVQQKHYSLLLLELFLMTAYVCRNEKSEPCLHIAASCEPQDGEKAFICLLSLLLLLFLSSNCLTLRQNILMEGALVIISLLQGLPNVLR